ncbi:1,2-alpha-mannosidase [Monocercomonoides exilis]|uniref:1,2-alpha-mannosidase n=1 Tax=Monocercomonoides exilis TaxID=2049356 RepID=UPI00355A0960|nr:1,2-alpha-mannosidase [Monocercomonoides exilis]|eukprot:MONOS_7177.1-p1 / transcript=MONOS_7177.1 / gene=MONOS_7177 / organism=Monocercomonoides_exilis_PA203 / gene_product=1,2alpha-mannosidase / transcript_product=1,2alpha-mannosidase / location=Mono_scaffold00239:49836-51503(-) / protein_length=555 / sequence_SO=supercontig / SO=protein_coding / is_pseudo=false
MFVIWIFCILHFADFCLKSNVLLPINSSLPNTTVNQQDIKRRDAIKNAFVYAWDAYKLHAWGSDELFPLNKSRNEWLNGQATTMIDAISTICVMNLTHELIDIKKFLANSEFKLSGKGTSLFEVTIRILGGLISAYDLSNDFFFLEKATLIGNQLLQSFEANKRCSIPYNELFSKNPQTTMHEKSTTSSFYLPSISELEIDFGQPKPQDTALLSEVAVWLEFVALSDRTHDNSFAYNSLRALQVILNAEGRSRSNIIPYQINRDGMKFTHRQVTIGPPSDSFFEYLIKIAIYLFPDPLLMTSSTHPATSTDEQSAQGIGIEEHWMEQMLAFNRKMKGINRNGLVWWKTSSDWGRWDHLSCFVPGNLALGVSFLNGWRQFKWERPMTERDAILDELYKASTELMNTCVDMYRRSSIGLSGQFIEMKSEQVDAVQKEESEKYRLRPEVVESLFYLYRSTLDPKYKEEAWKIFVSIEKYCRIPPDFVNGKEFSRGYSSLSNVYQTSIKRINEMPSFFLSETLKYLYLIFCDPNTVFPLNEWVFTTEGHLLKTRKKLDN